tara:strand:- start:178 stop:405 length:228 start_codon:yes stop_codon:yes gene_type:complete
MSEDRILPKGLVILDKEPVQVKNPYSGESVVLQPDAVAVYDWIKGAEHLELYDDMNKGLDWFAKNEPDAYMVLLD